MAFGFFRKREETDANSANNANNNGVTLGDQGTISDILLTALLKGETITRKQALSIPSVASDVDLISNCIAAMPVKLYKRSKGKIEEVEGDIRTSLLNDDPKDTLDAFQLKKNLVIDYLMDKGGYAYVHKVGNEVDAIYYVEPENVTINYNFDPIYKSYTIFVGEKNYKDFEYIKLLRNTKNGAYGEGIVEELNDALSTALQTQLYQLGLVKTGGNKRGFLKSERRLGEAEITALKQAWRKMYANNTESVVVLNNGIDFKEASNSSVEMQLNESIKTLESQIDDIFHITEDFYETFKLAIYPIIKAFETALNRVLLLEKEKGKYFFLFDVKEIIRANPKERYESYKIAKDCGFMTTNEMRRAENMNEIDGLDVIDFGLGSVLYNVNDGTFYTPNTDSLTEAGKLPAEEEEGGKT